MNDLYLVFGIGAPIAGAFLTLAAGRVRRFAALAVTTAAFILMCGLIAPAARGQVFASQYFMADGLSVFFAVISSFVGAVILLFSIQYMKGRENLAEYYFLVTLFIGSMLGLVFSASLIWLYIFWEIAAICSWRLIGYFRRDADLKAANKAFLITFSGASLMLIGFIKIFIDHGTFSIAALKGSYMPEWVFLAVFIGIMAKSCVFPLGTWLPDAGVAPSTVTALLHAAVLVKIGIYGFARLFCFTFIMPEAARHYVPLLAVITSIVAGCAALRETDIKRILAQSTISQLAFILFGLSFASPISISGAILFIFAHALGKAALFLSAGIIEHATGTRDIRELGGLIKALPVTGAAFAISALSVAGIPPMAGFWGKFMILVGSIREGHFLLGGLAIFGAMLTFLYMLRLFNAIFLGKAAHPSARERAGTMVAGVLILAFFSLAGGLLIAYPARFAGVIAAGLRGIPGSGF